MLSIRRGHFVIVLTSIWGVAAAVGASAAATTGGGPSAPSAHAAGPGATAAAAPDESSARAAAPAPVDAAAVGGAIEDLAGTFPRFSPDVPPPEATDSTDAVITAQDSWSTLETDQFGSRSLYSDCDHVSCLICGGDPSPRTRYGCGCGDPGYAASHEVAACQACVIRTSTICTIHMTLWD